MFSHLSSTVGCVRKNRQSSTWWMLMLLFMWKGERVRERPSRVTCSAAWTLERAREIKVKKKRKKHWSGTRDRALLLSLVLFLYRGLVLHWMQFKLHTVFCTVTYHQRWVGVRVRERTLSLKAHVQPTETGWRGRVSFFFFFFCSVYIIAMHVRE